MESILEAETRESHLANLRTVDAAMMPFGHTLGFRVERVMDGEAVVVMECRRDMHNIFGYMHGGAIFSIADTAIGLAHVASLDTQQTGTTVESKINFLRPALDGKLRAHARCVKQGRNLSLFECDVLDEENRLIARISATMMALEGERSEGRRRLYAVPERAEADLARQEGA
jgi:uncharacterized protein (TIGR00369 family)